MQISNKIIPAMPPSLRFRRDKLSSSSAIPQHDRGGVRAPPFPRIRRKYANDANGYDAFGIIASQYITPNSIGTPRLELYLRTRRPVVVKYALFEHQHVRNWPVWDLSPLDLSSREHEQFSLRMRRCGAITAQDSDGWQVDGRWLGVTEVSESPGGHIFR